MHVRHAPPALGQMFVGFFGVGVMGFGGSLPWLRRMMVERQRWVLPDEFNDLLALCQFLPGPNVVNMAVATGARFRGSAGALACVSGLLTAPFAIVLALGGLFERYGHVVAVAHAFDGLAAGAAGLIVATAAKVAAPLSGHRVGAGIAAISFALVAVFSFPLLPTMLVLAPLSVALCAKWPRQRARPAR